MQINQSWSWFIWPLGVLALAVVLPWDHYRRRAAWLVAGIVLAGAPLVGAFFYHASLDRSVWFGAGDPFGQDAGFDEVSQRLLGLADTHDAKWIATTDYRLYAALNWHIGRQVPVIMVTQRSRFIGFTQPAVSGPALYVYGDELDPLLADLELSPLEPIPVIWRGEEMRRLKVSLLDRFSLDLEPPPHSPYFPARL